MYDTQTNRCNHRIVSVHQPHIRPIVRGKNKNKVALGLSLSNGYTRIHPPQQAYHEGVNNFQQSVEAHRSLYGHYPELVKADAIYATKANRAWAKRIGMTAKPLGRPPKEKLW